MKILVNTAFAGALLGAGVLVPRAHADDAGLENARSVPLNASTAMIGQSVVTCARVMSASASAQSAVPA